MHTLKAPFTQRRRGMLAAGCCLLLCLAASGQQAMRSLPARPNILWITCEDLSPFLPPYGDSTVQTPYLSQLASEGITFTRMFSTYGVCGPSRASIITGMYPTAIGAMHMRTGTVHQDIPWLPNYEAVPPPAVKCFTEYLRAAGYFCSNNKKTDYQFRCPVTAWDENGKNAHWRHRRPGQPFFAVFNIEITHESRLWTRQQQPLRVDPGAVPAPPYYPQHDPVIRRNIARMYDNVMVMDRQVGTLLEQLRADGLLDSTIIFFFSDHGGPLAWYKREASDRGTRVPFLVRFPDGRQAGGRDSALHSLVDLAPTLLSLAGLPLPTHLQGQAFLGPRRAAPRAYVFTARDRMDEQYDLIRAVHDGRYQYIRNYVPGVPYYHDNAYRMHMPMMQEILRLRDADSLNAPLKRWFSPKAPEELYDTRRDPFELHNLAADPRYDTLRQRLAAALDRWIVRTGDRGFMQESALINMQWPGGRQPVTATPEFRVREDQGRPLLEMVCATRGASIAYRLAGDSPGHWRLYSGPLPLAKGQRLQAKAIRIGFAESAAAEYTGP